MTITHPFVAFNRVCPDCHMAAHCCTCEDKTE